VTVNCSELLLEDGIVHFVAWYSSHEVSMVVDKIVQPEQCHLLLRSKQVLSFDPSGKYGFDGLAVVL
jgi:hypothetical protein